MDMTITAEGTYDVTLEMRDTTSTVFDTQPDCSPYTDPSIIGSIIGAPEGTDVTAKELTGEDGSGCLVTITGVAVPKASATTTTDAAGTDSDAFSPLVVRDKDLYVVTLPQLFADDEASATAETTEASDTDTDASLDSLTEARVSVTFPGAVVEDGGGDVSGTTVTWTDADTIADGVSASGYAIQGEGTSVWQGVSPWVTGALVATAALLGLAVVGRRRRRGRRRHRL